VLGCAGLWGLRRTTRGARSRGPPRSLLRAGTRLCRTLRAPRCRLQKEQQKKKETKKKAPAGVQVQARPFKSLGVSVGGRRQAAASVKLLLLLLCGLAHGQHHGFNEQQNERHDRS
jgi:hypothetical protein